MSWMLALSIITPGPNQINAGIESTQVSDPIYFGISSATLPVTEVDLGHGLLVSQTYAHLMPPPAHTTAAVDMPKVMQGRSLCVTL